ncbi:GNAT family N-acetyltransferase [Modestobacter marinus]|uniref:N-acetyltransferase n=1 Tax=Modestobacter marinus TaxID=477641 RepID=A0ABQ2GD15_9ACTN|nr:GNAT family N-acetyltransferase [Modestobacter marinus]GGL86236.1 N-acetyltransferase [Modestobacter marinus]
MTAERALEEITPENVDEALAIEVRADQRHAVSPVAKSLAEAYAFDQRAWPRLIRHQGQAVGFVMAFFDFDFNYNKIGAEPDLRSGLWRLNIAAAHQGRGHGRFAVAAVAAELRRRGTTRLTTTWHVGDGSPESFYLGLGFRPTGEMSDDERVGELRL